MAILALYGAELAAQENSLAFSTAPATNTHRPPAPNVIISVDDSGSMAQRDGSNETKIDILKSALKETFKESNVPDRSIRLGWMSMNACRGRGSSLQCRGTEEPSIRVLDANLRQQFISWVDGLHAEGGTPAHRMLYRAGEYLRRAPGIDNPWASNPGVEEGEYLGCRRSYNVFLTDGSWNFPDMDDGNRATYGPSWLRDLMTPEEVAEIGNADGTDRVLPSGVAYDADSDQVRIYRDQYGAMNAITDRRENVTGYRSYPTLSDLAFYYWATDLQPHIRERNGEYTLPQQITFSGVEQIAADGRQMSLQEYWNPKNNPATWPHMTMFTVGFGSGAKLSTPAFGSHTWDGVDYQRLLLGRKEWGNPNLEQSTSGNYESEARRAEMWHAAINSRGTFVPVDEPTQLAQEFQKILNKIISDNSTPTTSVALTASTVRLESQMYVTTYDPSSWTGAVSAYKVSAASGAVATGSGWNSASKLDEARGVGEDAQKTFAENRAVFTHDGVAGVSFLWESLSAEQRQKLNGSRATVDYLRGGPDGNYRQRRSVHGDIVNSQVWYYNGDAANLRKPNKKTGAAQRRMVYVGANDGMLHAFDADNGSEAFAYVPRGVYDHLAELIRPDYVHRYFVDGSPFVAEVNAGSKDAPQWRDYLVGTLGAGGKGYFILDVTDPDSFSATNVKLDKTGADVDADIGHIFSAPVTDQVTPTRATQLTQLNNGKWAFVTGNGYNSVNQNSVLLIQYLDGQLGKLTAEPASKVPGNGLSAPRLVDLTGDGVPDVAYAGDLSGNLWKFDISSKDESKWKVSFAGQPLFTATDGLGQPQPQPITTAPGFVRHPSEPGLILTFGTGRNLTNEDRRSDDPQTIYGIHDRSGWTISNGIASVQDDAANRVERDDLVNKSLLAHATQDSVWKTDADDADEQVSYATKQWVNGETVSVTPDKGWYINLPVVKSRVLANVEWFRDPAIFRVRFQVPAEGGAGGVETQQESCEPVYSERRDFLGYFDAVSGNSWRKPLPNGERDPYTFYEDPAEGLSHYLSDGEGGDVSVAPPGFGKEDNLPGEGFTGLIPTWRHVQ
ncbi:hypothetical protein AAV94_01020 [Lampropedia cohaerens]|uniref:PilY1 beta-propeller domain-containing protein n=1 Tax=Lampropedia cohaerens TaxID=1610491 RepID=A0A0U1Q2Q4_9BURK|nr:hypothetical protein AAV94_01020 [Lampropedia cohaerens]